MNETRLSCSVVRDLLPSYIEGITENETTRLVGEHLAECAECRELEETMRTAVPISAAPKRRLRFLRRAKIKWLIAAALSFIAALCGAWLLYSSEFCYENTDVGRLSAVEDYVCRYEKPVEAYKQTAPERWDIPKGTPVTVNAWAERDGYLYVAYTLDNDDHAHGIVTLQRGINGKYRPLDSSLMPSQLTAGIYGHGLESSEGNSTLYAIVGYNCREIYSADVEFFGTRFDGRGDNSKTVNIEITEPNFMHLYTRDEIDELVGARELGASRMQIKEILTLYDAEGHDVTAEYTDEAVDLSWVSSTGSMETDAVYWFMGLCIILGLVFVRYFLKND